MEITRVFYTAHRSEWRNWLLENHRKETEVWFKTCNKASGKPSMKYNDMVEECLCFGWIDGAVKKLDPESMAQRISPRRKKTFLSELNRQRIWKLQANGLMTPAGIEPILDQIGSPEEPLDWPQWAEVQMKTDPEVWAKFQDFPHLYKRLKIGWIAEIKGLSRQQEAQKRLDYLIKMTRLGKMYGTQPLANGI